MKFLFILCVVLIRKIDSFTRCKFEHSNRPPVQGPYTCRLETNESYPRDAFEFSEEIHLNETYFIGSDDEVRYIAIDSLEIKDLPKNIFKRFPNAQYFSIINTTLEQISRDIFINANELKTLWILRNKHLIQIEENFLTDRNFERIELIDNGISKLTSFGSSDTLESLYIIQHNIRRLQNKTFAHISRLNWLSLSKNLINFIDDDAFFGLAKLYNLEMKENQIQSINSKIFSPLTNVQFIELNENKIGFIDERAFDANKKLKHIGLKNNRLTFISFLKSLNTLNSLDISGNQISAVDKFSLDHLTSIKNIFAIGNLCVDKNVTTHFMEDLKSCFENYKRPPCKYEEDKNNEYTCRIVGTGYLQHPKSIIDDHVIGRNNEKVENLILRKVSGNFSFPLLVNDYRNLKKIYIFDSTIPHILQQNFICEKMKVVDIRFSLIKELSGKIFTHCRELREIILTSNKIRSVPLDFFEGLEQIELIDVSFNYIAIFKAFRNLSSLNILNFNGNRLTDISNEDFENLKKLTVLKLNSNKIYKIEENAFNTLISLEELHLAFNGIEELPTMSHMQKLTYLNLEGNKIREITALPLTIEYLDISNNHISKIDANIWNSLTNLNDFFSSKNNCINGEFTDIQLDEIDMSAIIEQCQ